MTRSDFQKKSSSEATPNLAPNTARKVYVSLDMTISLAHVLDVMRLQRDYSGRENSTMQKVNCPAEPFSSHVIVPLEISDSILQHFIGCPKYP